MKISKFATDKAKEAAGVWVELGGGLRVLVARVGNTKYEDHLRIISKPYTHQMRHGTMDAGVAEDLTKQAVARHVLLDWKNLTDDDDNEIPFSSEKALELFRAHRDFFTMIFALGQDANLFRAVSQEEAKGNSSSTSGG